MSMLVESLRRLYHNNPPPRVTLEKLQQMLENGKISQAEYDYITAP